MLKSIIDEYLNEIETCNTSSSNYSLIQPFDEAFTKGAEVFCANECACKIKDSVLAEFTNKYTNFEADHNIDQYSGASIF